MEIVKLEELIKAAKEELGVAIQEVGGLDQQLAIAIVEENKESACQLAEKLSYAETKVSDLEEKIKDLEGKLGSFKRLAERAANYVPPVGGVENHFDFTHEESGRIGLSMMGIKTIKD